MQLQAKVPPHRAVEAKSWQMSLPYADPYELARLSRLSGIEVKYYVKIGGGPRRRALHSLAELVAWRAHRRQWERRQVGRRDRPHGGGDAASQAVGL
jgi:hypothetical protein